MRYFDQEEAAGLNAEAWQIDLLACNPSYCSWGPSEDYMWKEGEGWNSRVVVPSWSDFGWRLDDMNECANFYFEVSRGSKECPVCTGDRKSVGSGKSWSVRVDLGGRRTR